MVCASDDEVRYEDGVFRFPEKEEENTEKEQTVKKVKEPSDRKKLVAKTQARFVTFLMAVLKAIFQMINYLLIILSRLI